MNHPLNIRLEYWDHELQKMANRFTTKDKKMRPCVKCLSKKYKRIIAGRNKEFCIIQCECGFYQSGQSWPDVENQWNKFKVWELVKGTDCTPVEKETAK
jgi:hypothetical protein